MNMHTHTHTHTHAHTHTYTHVFNFCILVWCAKISTSQFNFIKHSKFASCLMVGYLQSGNTKSTGKF